MRPDTFQPLLFGVQGHFLTILPALRVRGYSVLLSYLLSSDLQYILKRFDKINNVKRNSRQIIQTLVLQVHMNLGQFCFPDTSDFCTFFLRSWSSLCNSFQSLKS